MYILLIILIIFLFLFIYSALILSKREDKSIEENIKKISEHQ